MQFKKNLAVSTLFLFSINSFATPTQVQCLFEDGGYDDELITLNLNQQNVESIIYESFMGEISPFVKTEISNVFSYTSDELVIKYIAYISDNLKSVTLVALYKNGASPVSVQEFICK
jgi:hypothetical protein